MSWSKKRRAIWLTNIESDVQAHTGVGTGRRVGNGRWEVWEEGGKKRGTAVPYLNFLSWMRCRTQRSVRQDFSFSEPRSSARAAGCASLALRLPARSRWSARHKSRAHRGAAGDPRGSHKWTSSLCSAGSGGWRGEPATGIKGQKGKNLCA